MSKVRTTAIWIGLILLFVVAFKAIQSRSNPAQVDYETFTEDLNAAHVSEVRFQGNEIHVVRQDGETYRTWGYAEEELLNKLDAQRVTVHWGEPPRRLATLLTWVVPIAVGLLVFIYFLRKAQGGTTNILSLRKSTARPLAESSKVTFDDVGGAEDAKEQLGDIIDYLKNPDRWHSAGVRLPRGVLLEGPPGCGKTLLARAVAGEAKVPFFTVSASEFVEMFVGVGAARVRDMFETAAKQAPAVIFIDELDAVGRKRGSGVGAAHDEREQTLNQLLVCLDGFEQNPNVVVLAATNRADVLDKALLRAGRFDSRIRVPEPSRGARLQTLEIHTRTKTLAADLSLEDISERTAGYTGADLESLTNEAARLAVRRARRDEVQGSSITKEDFLSAMKPHTDSRFNKLDSAIIESASQLAQPTGKTELRLGLKDGSTLDGELVWADAGFLKIRRAEDGVGMLVPKTQIQTLEALAGTEKTRIDDIVGDRWAARMPDLA